MEIETAEQLAGKRCKPCEGGVAPCTRAEAEEQLARLDGWTLREDGRWIEKRWKVKNFQAGMDFLNRVADIAEADGHHPDIHLVGYREVRIELSTHAIGGLSENDFILAAKIDRVAATS